MIDSNLRRAICDDQMFMLVVVLTFHIDQEIVKKKILPPTCSNAFSQGSRKVEKEIFLLLRIPVEMGLRLKCCCC